MTKRQLIDEIVSLNSTAQPAFLARFEDMDLSEYLQHLKNARTPRLSGDPHRYDKHFHARQNASYPPANYGMDADLSGTDSQERAALLSQAPADPADPEMQSDDQPVAQEQADVEVDAETQVQDIPAAVATALDDGFDDTLLAYHDDTDAQDVDCRQDEPTAQAVVEPAPAVEPVPAVAEAPATIETPAVEEAVTEIAAPAPAEVAETAAVEVAAPQAAAQIEAAVLANEAPAEAPAEVENKTAQKPFADAQEDSQSWLF